MKGRRKTEETQQQQAALTRDAVVHHLSNILHHKGAAWDGAPRKHAPAVQGGAVLQQEGDGGKEEQAQLQVQRQAQLLS
jgi:hypothetical protein